MVKKIRTRKFKTSFTYVTSMTHTSAYLSFPLTRTHQQSKIATRKRTKGREGRGNINEGQKTKLGQEILMGENEDFWFGDTAVMSTQSGR